MAASNTPKTTARRRRASAGVAAVEFAVTVPIFVLILMALVDTGRVVLLQMRLESDVAAVANYAVPNAALVNSTSAPSLALLMAQAMGGNVGATLNSGKVIVNNGSVGSVSNGTTSVSGNAAYADACYCPAGSASPWVWGSSVACGSTCSAGSLAGKFVSVVETQAFKPVFSAYSFVAARQISANIIVRTQ